VFASKILEPYTYMQHNFEQLSVMLISKSLWLLASFPGLHHGSFLVCSMKVAKAGWSHEELGGTSGIVLLSLMLCNNSAIYYIKEKYHCSFYFGGRGPCAMKL